MMDGSVLVPDAGVTLAIALAAGVAAQSLSRQVRVPSIILLLLIGAGLGPEGMGWIEPAALGDGLFNVVDFGIAVILFEGGLNLEWSRLRRQELAIRQLITLGALATFAGGAALAWLVLGWRWDVALLFGSLVVVTGPTVVAPLLRDMRLRPRVRTVLEAEGVLIDPIGALLAVAVLQVVLTPAVETLTAETRAVAASLGFGLVAGLASGLVLVAALRYRLLARGYEQIFTLAAVVLLFEVCGVVVVESGLMAVTVAGVVVGNLETRVTNELREFKDRLTVLLVGLLFVLLAADVSVAEMRALGTAGLAVVAGLIFIVRPIAVLVSTAGSQLRAKERAFVAAVAPRGIVAAAVTSITAADLAAHGVPGGQELRAMVFLVIAVTVVVAGVSARPLAWLLDVRLPQRDRVAILGARGLGLALADQLRRGNVSVVFIESDPKRSRLVEEAGYSVVFGDALEERTVLRARPELVGTVIGATFNEHFNSLFVRNALRDFGVPHGLVAMESLFEESAPRLLPDDQADVLFDGPHDHERWDVRWRHDQVTVEEFEYAPRSGALDHDTLALPAAVRSRERFVVISIRRGKKVSPMRVRYALRAGDRAAIAIHTPDRERALPELAGLGWRLQS